MMWFVFLTLAASLGVSFYFIAKKHLARTEELNRLAFHYEQSLALLRDQPESQVLQEQCMELGKLFYQEMLPGPYGGRIYKLNVKDIVPSQYLSITEAYIRQDMEFFIAQGRPHSRDSKPPSQLAS